MHLLLIQYFYDMLVKLVKNRLSSILVMSNATHLTTAVIFATPHNNVNTVYRFARVVFNVVVAYFTCLVSFAE